MPVATAARPLPSRPTLTDTSVSAVFRLMLALRMVSGFRVAGG